MLSCEITNIQGNGMFDIQFNDITEVDEEFKNRAKYGRKLAVKTKYDQMFIGLEKNGEVNQTILSEKVKWKLVSVE